MKKIDSKPKNLRELLQNIKYTIHYYQREYRWQKKHVDELIDDLTTEFLNNYKAGDKRADVQNYGAYFMGSIVIAGPNNAIIDGQQRFSTLTLLLMYLNNRLREKGKNYPTIDQMIFSESFGEKSFNINVEERQNCMKTIFNGGEFSIDNSDESVKNLWARYKDIEEDFPEEITDKVIFHFCDWLIEKVYFVEIVAETDQDAQKIFVTMNDRGLNLTSTEMLKGYLLSEIVDDKKHESLNAQWKDKISALKKDDDKGDEIFIKAWLRAQYARDENDSDLIGGAFHKWVRDSHEALNLNNSADYENFIETMFHFVDIYFKIKTAEKNFDEATIKILKVILKNQYEILNYDSSALQNLRLNNFTKKYIKNILARITSFIEEQTKVKANYVEYMTAQAKNAFEIEHIICNDFEKFHSAFSGKEELRLQKQYRRVSAPPAQYQRQS